MGGRDIANGTAATEKRREFTVRLILLGWFGVIQTRWFGLGKV